VNEADQREVRRFYIIDAFESETIRAWQGHKREQKWFYPIKGKGLLKALDMLDYRDSAMQAKVSGFILEERNPAVLHLPGAYYNGIQALAPGFRLLVFSDFNLEDSEQDDFRLHLDEFS